MTPDEAQYRLILAQHFESQQILAEIKPRHDAGTLSQDDNRTVRYLIERNGILELEMLGLTFDSGFPEQKLPKPNWPATDAGQ